MTCIAVTYRCNMNCLHCSRGSKHTGPLMSMKTFKAAIDFAMARDDGSSCITITGGEPTLHPKLKDFVCYALCNFFPDYAEMEYPAIFIVTNGTVRDTALWLAKMSRFNRISAVLSFDDWHDTSMVHPEVHRQFDRLNKIWKQEGIRSIGSMPWKTGNGKSVAGAMEGCACDDIHVQPNGDIVTCGCEYGTKIGNVHDTWEFPENFQPGECPRHWEPIEEDVA